MLMINTHPRTRENDIWTYDAPDSGSGTTGAIAHMHVQVGRQKVRRWLYIKKKNAAVDHVHGVGDGDGNAVGVSCPAVPGLQCV